MFLNSAESDYNIETRLNIGKFELQATKMAPSNSCKWLLKCKNYFSCNFVPNSEQMLTMHEYQNM